MLNPDKNKKSPLIERVKQKPALALLLAGATIGLPAVNNILGNRSKLEGSKPQISKTISGENTNLGKSNNSANANDDMNQIMANVKKDQNAFYNANKAAIEALRNDVTWEQKVQNSSDGGGSRFKTPEVAYGKGALRIREGYSLTESQKELLKKLKDNGMGFKFFGDLVKQRTMQEQMGRVDPKQLDSGKTLADLNAKGAPKLRLESEKPNKDEG